MKCLFSPRFTAPCKTRPVFDFERMIFEFIYFKYREYENPPLEQYGYWTLTFHPTQQLTKLHFALISRSSGARAPSRRLTSCMNASFTGFYSHTIKKNKKTLQSVLCLDLCLMVCLLVVCVSLIDGDETTCRQSSQLYSWWQLRFKAAKFGEATTGGLTTLMPTAGVKILQRSPASQTHASFSLLRACGTLK